MAGKIQDADVKGSSEVTADSRLVNDNKIYVSSLGKRLDQAVAAGDLGADSSNYVSALNNEISVSGTVYADAAATSPVDGTGGSASVTWANSGSSPLRGSQSKLFIKDAANRQGQGFSYDFTIADADKLKVIQGRFSYAVASGTFADGDMTFWIYDITNAVLIPVTPYRLLNHGAPSEKFFFEFQTTSSNSYRFIGHVSSTSATAYSLKFDDFELGPQSKSYGSQITNPVDYTPTFAGLGTVTVTQFQWSRFGKFMRIQGKITLGTTTGSTASFSLPNNLVADVSSTRHVGFGVFSGTTAAPGRVAILAAPTPNTSLFFGVINASLNAAAGTSIGSAGDVYSIDAMVPIVGWSSSTVMSEDADTRLVSLRATYSPGTIAVPNSATTFVWDTVVKDTHGAYNTSTGIYTVKIPGDYVVNYRIQTTGSVVNQFNSTVRVNGVGIEGRFVAQQVASSFSFVTTGPILLTDLKAGDQIDVQFHESVDGANLTGTHSLMIYKLLGPSQIAASESVVVRATSSAGQSVTSSGNVFVGGTKVFDSHGAYNASTGIFTAPISGIYRVACYFEVQSTAYTAGNAFVAELNKNGSLYCGLAGKRMDANITAIQFITGSTTIHLLAGETSTVLLASSVNTNLSTAASRAHVTIERVGNYA